MTHTSIDAHLLGTARLVRDGRPLSVSPMSLRLYAYLLTRPGRHATRQQLMDALGDQASAATARRRLNTAVWRLRCALQSTGGPNEERVISCDQGLAIAPGCHTWVDVEDFDRACRVARPVAQWNEADAQQVAEALENYTGDFLEGFYDDWVLIERARLREVHVSALLRMTRWHENHGLFELALGYAQRAAATEPLHEDLQRLLMREYRRAGLPEMAAHHYSTFRTLLADELGVKPSPETMSAGLGPWSDPPLAPDQTTTRAVREVLMELEHTRQELREITSHVENSINALRDQLVPD